MKPTYTELDINTIDLDLDNPRIKQYLEMYGTNVTAEGISLALHGSDADGSGSFNSLKESIRVNGGVINPIIVNHTSDDKLVVIEGNTRLQIYKDFAKSDNSGNWDKICAMVYENLSMREIDSIRLQAHLVGPREWDRYSKAKYLHHLSNVDYLPMNVIISYCGNKKGEIMNLIEAYIFMQEHYTSRIPKDDFNPKVFSKFEEYIKKTEIRKTLIALGYQEQDFADWVINNNVDTAENVRKLPAVLKSEPARKEFLKTNISNAVKKIESPVSDTDLSKVSLESLTTELINRINKIPFPEAQAMKLGGDKVAVQRKELLLDLDSALADIVTFMTSE